MATTTPNENQRSFTTFVVIWAGQLVSTLGSGLTGFAVSVWLYETTGSTTLFAINMLAYMIPNIFLAPLIGALVDRYDRRKIMILADTGAGLMSATVAVLFYTGHLQFWHLYLTTFIGSSFSAFQWPAWSAVTTLLVPKKHLGRASGMVQIGEAISGLFAPAIGGVLFVTIGFGGVLAIDFATFLFAVGSLLLIRVPQPEQSTVGKEAQGSLWQEGLFGIRYVLDPTRRGLLGLLLYFAAWNLFWGVGNVVLIPMVLDIADPDLVGYLSSIAGIGMLIGTLIMSAWGGPKRRELGMAVLGGAGALGIIVAGLTDNLYVITGGMFWFMLGSPIFGGLSQTIWQSKVEPDLQGRVFTARRMVAWSTTPIAYLAAGPLADAVFKPAMAEGGALAPILGPIFGVGAARGSGVLISLMGLLVVISSVVIYLYPPFRRLDAEIPDAILDEEEEKPLEDTPAALADVSAR